ncbi:hypothetical protein QYF36_023967 [Acer negundo]|nr:hypothetical protein QYF36_023967 [Acer negundo]
MGPSPNFNLRAQPMSKLYDWVGRVYLGGPQRVRTGKPALDKACTRPSRQVEPKNYNLGFVYSEEVFCTDFEIYL